MRCMTCHNIATMCDRWKCIPSVVGAVPRLEVGISKTLRKRFARNFLSYGLVLSIPLGLSRDKIWREKLFLGLVQNESKAQYKPDLFVVAAHPRLIYFRWRHGTTIPI